MTLTPYEQARQYDRQPWCVHWRSPSMPAPAFDYLAHTASEAFNTALGYASRGGTVATVVCEGVELITFGNGGCTLHPGLLDRLKRS